MRNTNFKVTNPFAKFLTNILMGLILLVISFSGVGVFTFNNNNGNTRVPIEESVDAVGYWKVWLTLRRSDLNAELYLATPDNLGYIDPTLPSSHYPIMAVLDNNSIGG